MQRPPVNFLQHAARLNLTLQKIFTAKQVGSNSNIIIKSFDEILCICLIFTPLYISEIQEHFLDHTTYEKHDFDPTQAIRNVVLLIANFLHSSHEINNQTRNQYTTKACTHSPFIFPLKVYKLKIPNLTNIISISLDHQAALRLLKPFFSQLLVKVITLCISKSKHFVQLFIWLPLLPNNYNQIYHNN